MADDQPAAGRERPEEPLDDLTRRLRIEVDRHISAQNNVDHRGAIGNRRVAGLSQVQLRKVDHLGE